MKMKEKQYGGYSSKDSLIQNLKDAGCEEEVVEQFLALDQDGKTKEQLELLASHRCQLLKEIHEGEKQIDCLDYLVYRLQKN